MHVHRRKGARRAPRGFELIPLGTGSTVLSGLSRVPDIFSTWAALEGRPASWALCLPPPPPPQEPACPWEWPAASSLGKFRELRQKFMCKGPCSATAEEDYNPSALARSPPLSGHRETFQGQHAGPPLCLAWVFRRCSAPPFLDPWLCWALPTAVPGAPTWLTATSWALYFRKKSTSWYRSSSLSISRAWGAEEPD